MFLGDMQLSSLSILNIAAKKHKYKNKYFNITLHQLNLL